MDLEKVIAKAVKEVLGGEGKINERWSSQLHEAVKNLAKAKFLVETYALLAKDEEYWKPVIKDIQTAHASLIDFMRK